MDAMLSSKKAVPLIVPGAYRKTSIRLHWARQKRKAEQTLLSKDFVFLANTNTNR